MMVRQCEILAPAGKAEDIPAIVEAGADALYVGLSGCSARPQSADFSREEIARVLPELRARHIPLHIAVNANVRDAELPKFYEDIRFLDALPVDAFIFSDYGALLRAASIVRNARVHASTLTGVYNAECVRRLQSQGVSRVILSSDLFLDEIVALTDSVPDMEYEIVADGGICFHSNRQCLLPHRGEGENYQVSCQKRYDLFRDGTFVRHAKRIGNAPGKIHRMMGLYLGMGICSFKAEGRTNARDYIVKRIHEMAESKQFYMSHLHEIPGYMHYVRRGYTIEESV